MKYQLSLKTITPVHIGSGEELMPGTEYITFKNESRVAVLTPHKVFDIIGQENIHHWISIIEKKGDLLNELLKVRQPQLKPEDVSSRTIIASKHLPVKEKIKAQLHLGKDLLPAIPGTSVKGSLRTVLLNHLIKITPQFAANERNLGRERNGRIQFKDDTIEANYLAPQVGKNFRVDPRKDLLRILFVGDTLFKCQTELHKSMVINEYHPGWDEKKSLSSYFECIPASQATHMNITIQEDLLREIKKRQKLNIPNNFPAYDLPELLKVINNHTLFLLNDELEFWQNEDNPIALGDYVEHLQEIASITNNCSETECVMRVGSGSGWDFMTGAWPRGKDNNGNYILKDPTWKKLKRDLRRGNYPDAVPFPKTRKLIQGGIPFGFIKLGVE